MGQKPYTIKFSPEVDRIGIHLLYGDRVITEIIHIKTYAPKPQIRALLSLGIQKIEQKYRDQLNTIKILNEVIEEVRKEENL